TPTGHEEAIKQYHLKKEQTRYLYDGATLLNEYTGAGDPLAQYYMGADDQIVSRKMFGFHGRKDQGYLGNLRDRGHQLFYHYDAMGNVNDLTDHLGSDVLKYRYDAFGGVFTQLWTPYNNVGLTGKSYDIKASLMDYSARWYSPAEAHFTTKDTWAGLQDLPQTLNRYAYALNNPINITDPSGHAPCYEDDDGVLHCGYDPDPDNWEPRGGGGGGGGGYTPPNPDPVDPDPTPLPPAWMDVAKRAADLLAAAGFTPEEIQKIIPQLFSTGVDFIPVVGNIKSGLEATLGIDLITGEKLSTFDRVTAGISAFSLNSGALRTGLKTAGKVADVALDTSRHTDDLTDVSRALSCGRCFGAGTKVATDEGPKNIEDIQVGDRVLSKNDVTGDLDYKEVEDLFTRIAPDVYVITIGEEQITTTAEHPFYIHHVGWVRTQDLHIGDEMETSSGMTAAVEKIQRLDEPTKVYNFSVKDYHTYFVSELKVWTHNSSKDCGVGIGETGKGVVPYEIGRYNQLSNKSLPNDNIEIHHAAQKHPANQVIPGYDGRTAPSIALPRSEHRAIPAQKGIYTGNPRDLLAKDIWDLRNYTNAPNSSLKELIQKNKNASPGAFQK
ncbi:polymorphic toxin-type HINT domain-containing protein, partial [Tumebacillus sp. DT12]